MRLLLMLLSALCACGPRLTFDFDQPLRFEFSADVYGERCSDRAKSVIETALASAVAQLGSRIGAATENPTIRVERKLDDCSEKAGYGEAGLFRLCSSSLCDDPLDGEVVVKHELGHALRAGHLACDDRSIMCPGPFHWISGPDYSAADIAEICQRNRGGICL